MRYSISNAIPHNPKSEKHPYENLVKPGVYRGPVLFLCKNDNDILEKHYVISAPFTKSVIFVEF